MIKMEITNEYSRAIPKGAVKAGLDTCFLCNIVNKNIKIEWLKKNFFPSNTFFYYCGIIEKEFKGVLRRKSGLKGLDAKREWEKIAEELDMLPIRWSRAIEEDFVPKVMDANEKIVEKRDVPGFSKTLRIGRGDIEIIASFMKENLDRIYTSDDGFYLTCKELGMNAIKVKLSKFWRMQDISREEKEKNEYGDDE